jgi:aryl carrier-like protein
MVGEQLGRGIVSVLEEVMVHWRAVLRLEAVDANDDFFLLGGDSLDALRLLDVLADSGYELDISEVFEFPTPAEQASILDGRTSSEERIAAHDDVQN